MNKNDIRGITVFLVVVVLLFAGYFYPRRPNNQKFDIPAEQPNIPVEQYPQYKVVPGSVYDGDTIRVVPMNVNGFPKDQQLKIRFACIDAPERKQPGGIEARDELKQLLEMDGNRVKLNIITTDRYG
ncbi:MAG: hypothetical protein SWJ54_16270 [Cyanobacteriota bacterium]|nr:hypothetical protein [Cyanobacteriota bacterium]